MTKPQVLPRLLTALALLAPIESEALTMNDISSFCDGYPGECSTSPFLQAYVGGALDLIAMLDEETDYLDEVYCRSPREFFDAQKIVSFMLENKSDYSDKNAMLLVIRYLEENGGCNGT